MYIYIYISLSYIHIYIYTHCESAPLSGRPCQPYHKPCLFFSPWLMCPRPSTAVVEKWAAVSDDGELDAGLKSKKCETKSRQCPALSCLCCILFATQPS